MFSRRRPRSASAAPLGSRSAVGESAPTTAAKAAVDLAHLDRRSIAVELTTPAGGRVVTGVGVYENDPDLGGVLRLPISDDVAEYEMLFVADRWSGTIESGAAHGCDYLLRVG